MRPVISFLSDFGLRDSYVAEVKAVLLAGLPNATIVDITHEIPAYDIEAGAFNLMRAYRHFPKGAWHLSIVDPGVGSARLPIYVEADGHHFVGPDNGLLKWAARGGKAWAIPTPRDLKPTFHGRDLFAPFIVRPRMGSRVEMSGRDFPAPGEIVYIDHYGNAVTSTPATARPVTATVKRTRLSVASSYASIPRDKAALIRGSHGFWEIAASQSSAARRLNLKKGDRVKMSAIIGRV